MDRARTLFWAKNLFRLVVLALVLWGVYRTIGSAIDDLRSERVALEGRIEDARKAVAAARSEQPPAADRIAGLEEQLEQLQRQRFSLWPQAPGWLVLAGVFYLLGSAPSWIFWHRTMRAMGQHPRWYASLRAFYIGHLGKYVPGKALVVVLRAGLVRSSRVDTTVAATSVFVETLTMMSVGAMVAASILIVLSHEAWLIGLAIFLMVCAGVPTYPPLLRRVVKVLKVRRANPAIDEALAGLRLPLMAWGWSTIALGWLLMGLSLWAVMEGMGFDFARGPWERLEDLPLLTACVGLAMVAGFLSLIPGGFLVRELVVTAVLAEQTGYGSAMALAAAVVLRIVWLLAEVLLSIILYVIPPPREASPGDAAAPASTSPESA